jgi:uncharacterized glyoxalase superfamily protein PhnB
MKLASIRLVTHDLDRLAAFYATLTGIAATRLTPDFAEIRLGGAVLALSTERPIKQFNAGAAVAAANRSAIIEFQVEDVDGLHGRLSGPSIDCVMAPTDMPWGNRSMLLRDPDGNLVNVFAPVRRKAEAS